MTLKIRRLMLAAAAAQVFPAAAALAAAHTWIGPSTGSWFTPTAWSGGVVPNDPTADAFVDAGRTPQSTVSLDRPLTFRWLDITDDDHVFLTAGAVINGGTLTTSGTGRLSNTPNETVVINSLRNQGLIELTVSSVVQFNGFANFGTIECGGGAIVADDATDFSHGTLHLWGVTNPFTYNRPLTMSTGGLLRVRRGAFSPAAGTDLTATAGGKIAVWDQGSIGNAAGRDVVCDSGGLIYTTDAGRVLAIDGDVIARAGGLVVADRGTIAAAGGNVRAEPGGVLAGRGTLVNAQLAGGALHPGDTTDYLAPGPAVLARGIGSIVLQGGFSADAASSVRIDIAAGSLGTVTSNDLVNAGGAAVALAGNLVVQLVGAVPPLPGAAFDVMRYDSRSGQFDDVVNATPFAGLSFLPTYSAATLRLAVSARGGDANLDGSVNLTDFNILAENFGRPGNWLRADFTQDGLEVGAFVDADLARDDCSHERIVACVELLCARFGNDQLPNQNDQ